MNLNSKFKPPAAKEKNAWSYWVVATFIILILHNFFGALCYNFFVMLDNVLNASGAGSPVVMWTILGLFLGIMAGGLVAMRKFKLGYRAGFLSAIPVFIFMMVLLSNAKPLGQLAARPSEDSKKDEEQVSADYTLLDTTPVLTYNKGIEKEKKLVNSAPHSAEKPEAKPPCESQMSRVSLTVRSDSVKLFFRITQTKDGEWSDWESIFIPQPGQYALSGTQGKVSANSIQYYYEANREATRSASDPFTKILCNGALTIDTY